MKINGIVPLFLHIVKELCSNQYRGSDIVIGLNFIRYLEVYKEISRNPESNWSKNPVHIKFWENQKIRKIQRNFEKLLPGIVKEGWISQLNLRNPV